MPGRSLDALSGQLSAPDLERLRVADQALGPAAAADVERGAGLLHDEVMPPHAQFSLLFSFAAVRLVGGIPYALAPGRRYWVHLSLVFHELLRVAAGFWAFWSFRAITWTFPTYMLALAGPGLVYFLAATLVPADPTDVDSWRDFYFRVRRRYFLAIIFWTVAVATTTTILVQMPWSHPFRLVQLGFLAFGIVGATFASPRVHAGLASVSLVLPAIAALTVLLRPGSLAN